MLIDISFEYVNAPGALNERVKAALADKLVELTKMLHEKVVENVTGKILQKRTGALLAKIDAGVEIDTVSNPMVSFVGPVDPGPKEWALEKGGAGYYPIYPVKAKWLRFWNKQGELVFAKAVHHPPSLEFGYLKEAALEMEPEILPGFEEAIAKVFRGGI